MHTLNVHVSIKLVSFMQQACGTLTHLFVCINTYIRVWELWELPMVIVYTYITCAYPLLLCRDMTRRSDTLRAKVSSAVPSEVYCGVMLLMVAGCHIPTTVLICIVCGCCGGVGVASGMHCSWWCRYTLQHNTDV